MSIFSLQVEKHVIGGLVKHPQTFVDVSTFLSEKDFYNNFHSVAFCVIRDSILRSEKVDKVLVAQKIKALGISFSDDINVFDYIESICFTQITPEATYESCQELVKLRIAREIFETGEKLKSNAKNSISKSIDEIISTSDAIYNEKISALSLSEEPENLFKNIEQFVEERGNNPIEETGFTTPYPEFNRMYGGLRKKNLYAFVSRSGNGKSTFLSDILFKTAMLKDFKIDCLLLDTEMETEDLKWRIVSSLSGVGMWYLETGNWRKNEEMVNKVRPALKLMQNYKLDHFKVGNKSIDQIESIIRRWRFKKGRSNEAAVAYDYLKIGGTDKASEGFREYQIIGEKVDRLKKLMEDLDMPGLTAMQLNRTGENQNKQSKDVVDDSSAISLSDRLLWYATFVGILRRKTLDEVALDGIDFGTHKLIPTKTRFQGRDAAGHQDLILRKFADGSKKYVNNYLSFDITNFNVLEKGSLKNIIDKGSISNIEITDEEIEDKEDGVL